MKRYHLTTRDREQLEFPSAWLWGNHMDAAGDLIAEKLATNAVQLTSKGLFRSGFDPVKGCDGD